MKHLSMAIALIFCTLSAFAQSSSSSTVTATYKIRLAAFAKSFDMKAFDNVRDLGVVMTESTGNGMTRVFLGTYIDKATAQRVAAKAKTRGYSECYLVRDNYLFQSADGEQTHTLQFSANKSLDVKPIVTKLNADGVGQLVTKDMYIRYVSGYYRYSLGLFSPNNTTLINRYNTALRNIGITDMFVRQFRTPTGVIASATPDPVVTTTVVTSSPKDDKMNSSSTGTASNTNDKDAKMNSSSTGTASNTGDKDAKMNNSTTTQPSTKSTTITEPTITNPTTNTASVTAPSVTTPNTTTATAPAKKETPKEKRERERQERKEKKQKEKEAKNK